MKIDVPDTIPKYAMEREFSLNQVKL
jgi:hypothetical protein